MTDKTANSISSAKSHFDSLMKVLESGSVIEVEQCHANLAYSFWGQEIMDVDDYESLCLCLLGNFTQNTSYMPQSMDVNLYRTSIACRLMQSQRVTFQVIAGLYLLYSKQSILARQAFSYAHSTSTAREVSEKQSVYLDLLYYLILDDASSFQSCAEKLVRIVAINREELVLSLKLPNAVVKDADHSSPVVIDPVLFCLDGMGLI